jgi:ribonuclease HII
MSANTHTSEPVDMWHYEKLVAAQGFRIVAGIDEAGRGPIAGPVVAAAVVLPFHCDIDGINDSKKLTPAKREAAFAKITSMAKGIGVGIVDAEEIDRINILQATTKAMHMAAAQLALDVKLFLVDGNPVKGLGYPHRAIVKGDAKSASIAAASIIAKVTRDRMMCEYHAVYPEYGFDKHKGYLSEEHKSSLFKHGACKIHRRSFEPVKSLCSQEEDAPRQWVQTELF